MSRGSRLRWLLAPSIAVIITFSFTAYEQSSPPITLSNISTTHAADSVLPRNVIVPLNVVNQFFPEITQEASTGINLTAVGKPKATRSIIYTTSDRLKKVTITVDQYESSSDASSAYQQAVQKSKIPGFKPLSIPSLGQQAFAGTVTMNAETHVGLGTLDGNLIVGVTLAGYDASPNNIAKLITMARAEDAAAKLALSASESH